MTAEPTNLVLACATIAAVIIAISIAALGADCFCWFRQMRETRRKFKAHDRWHGDLGCPFDEPQNSTEAK
jgi:hypothetical protein